jgi:hypothetical protein
MLSDAGFDDFMKALQIYGPDANYSQMEFYCKERLIRRGIPFSKQDITNAQTLLAIPAGCKGAEVPSLLVCSTRAGQWNLQPKYPLPIYLRVHCSGAFDNDLLIESASHERIETLSQNVLSKVGKFGVSATSYTITLQVDGKPLVGLSVWACGVTPGTKIDARIDPIPAPPPAQKGVAQGAGGDVQRN